ncbi:hypothetical protein C4D60_Mb01t12680 [Musa balbisiana]|uniref:Uncharacterized protein n=1 Tax=Musa balbisiana TaxID=52838 RepID=A0A4S8JM33_MUSBA|nr:hypothetical protein C4D60_Mb01t12680 [Musa balbisiana]
MISRRHAGGSGMERLDRCRRRINHLYNVILDGLRPNFIQQMEANRISPAQVNMICEAWHLDLLSSCPDRYHALCHGAKQIQQPDRHPTPLPLISFVVASRRSDCCYASKRSSLLYNEISKRLQQVPSVVE